MYFLHAFKQELNLDILYIEPHKWVYYEQTQHQLKVLLFWVIFNFALFKNNHLDWLGHEQQNFLFIFLFLSRSASIFHFIFSRLFFLIHYLLFGKKESEISSLF